MNSAFILKEIEKYESLIFELREQLSPDHPSRTVIIAELPLKEKMETLMDHGWFTQDDMINYLNNCTPNMKVTDTWDGDSFMDGLFQETIS